MTLACEDDYDKIAEGAPIRIDGFYDAVAGKNAAHLVLESGEKIELVLSLTERQRAILCAGGTLNYTKSQA